MFTSQILAIGLLIAAPLTSAHGMITAASGDLGGKGIGLGVTAATSNSQNDVTVFKSGTFGAAGGVRPPPKFKKLKLTPLLESNCSRKRSHRPGKDYREHSPSGFYRRWRCHNDIPSDQRRWSGTDNMLSLS